ncbi:MAG: DUF669 domain-containing protein [Ruminococcus sp.]|nr:DUF669 domain-containing protein [Ruminococcus sp.]
MLNFNFNAQEYVPEEYSVLAAGDYRVRIAQAEEKTSQSGNEMVKLTLDVSGHNCKLWYYLVVTADRAQTTKAFGRFFESFGLNGNDPNIAKNPQAWIGATGAARVKQEDYNGEKQAKVAYLLDKKRQATLPNWIEPQNAQAQSAPPAPAYGYPPEPPAGTYNNLPPAPREYPGQQPPSPPFGANDLL